jgi:hypothetical protein
MVRVLNRLTMSQNFIEMWLNEKNASEFNCSNYKEKRDNKIMYYTPTETKIFKNKMFLGSRRYDADALFRQIIDYCIENEITDINEDPMFSSNNKNDFYKFVYENSCKKLKTQFVRAPEPIQVSSHEKSKYKMVELKPKEKYVKNNK